MNNQWQEYCNKYLQLTIREQYLILFTGLVAVFFILFHFFVDPVMMENQQVTKSIENIAKKNQTTQISIAEISMALQSDPNKATEDKIAQFEAKLAKIDEKLLTLTSDLINPVQMRYALVDLLKLEKGVSLLSFELLGAKPLLVGSKPIPEKKSEKKPKQEAGSTQANITDKTPQLNLYRHGIKIKLSGGYFQLQSYLKQLEQLKWKFFWQDFNFELKEYPQSELEITIYNLSTKKEFVGV